MVSGYDFVIKHVRGIVNKVADGLSRRKYEHDTSPTDDKMHTFPLSPSDIIKMTAGGGQEETISAVTRAQAKARVTQEHMDEVHDKKKQKRVTFKLPDDKTQQEEVHRNLPYVEGLAPRDIHRAQMADKKCADLIRFHAYDTIPPTYNREKAVRMTEMSYTVMQDPPILFHVTHYGRDTTRSARLRVVVPESLQQKIIANVHDSHIGSHFGYMKCAEIIKRNFIWRGMDRHIRNYIAKCTTCYNAKSTLPLQRIHPTPVTSGTQPMTKLAVDFLGKFSLSKDKFLYIACAICYTSRMLIAWPTRSTSAKDFAEGFIKNVVAIHGPPLQLVSDRGPNFVADIWKETAQLLGTELTYSSPFLPRANARVERVNRTLLSVLRCLCQRNPTTWSQLLPVAVFNINNTVHRTLGFAPHQVIYGRTLRNILEIVPPDQLSLAEHNFNLAHAQKEALHIINEHNLKMLAAYEPPPFKESQIKVGDICYWRRPALDDQTANKKLQIVNRGPFKVIKKTKHQVFLEDVKNNRHLKNPVSITQIVKPTIFDDVEVQTDTQ